MTDITAEDKGIIDYCLISRRVDLERLLKSPAFCDDVKESYRRELDKVNALFRKLNNRTA